MPVKENPPAPNPVTFSIAQLSWLITGGRLAWLGTPPDSSLLGLKNVQSEYEVGAPPGSGPNPVYKLIMSHRKASRWARDSSGRLFAWLRKRPLRRRRPAWPRAHDHLIITDAHPAWLGIVLVLNDPESRPRLARVSRCGSR